MTEVSAVCPPSQPNSIECQDLFYAGKTGLHIYNYCKNSWNTSYLSPTKATNFIRKTGV